MQQELQDNLASLHSRQHRTWQERQQTITQDWEAHRREIFKLFISRQPLLHVNCEQCGSKLGSTGIRCMTCKQHMCYKCDLQSHLNSPLHRRLFISSDIVQPLLPDDFTNEKSVIIKQGIRKKMVNISAISLLFFAVTFNLH